jgi:hypothetical protein
MKSEIWPDVGMPEMTDWLAELRDDDGDVEQPDGDDAAQATAGDPVPEAPVPAQVNRSVLADQTSVPAEAWPTGWAWTRPHATTPAETRPASWVKAPVGKHAAARRADAPGETAGSAEVTEPAGIAEITERAVIGDELRRPITWCEMDSCISWHADPAALGEADIRARAIGAGWRVDAFGRLVCPQCQQTAPGFRTSHSVVLWDRRAAIIGATRMAGTLSNGTARGHGRDPRRRASHPVTGVPMPGRHRGRPAAESMPVAQQAR